MSSLYIEDRILIHDVPFTLEELETDCWRRLFYGARSSREPMHYMSVASYGESGISLRTVVLRAADPHGKTLRFHTDTRSGKFRELQADPRVSVLCYDNPQKMQIRMTGIATLHTDDALAEECWQKTALHSRRCYLAEAAPSSPSDVPTTGLPEHLRFQNPEPEESEMGRKHFAVVMIRMHSLDWLYLHAHGHRRAHFTYADNGVLQTKQWLHP